jgi:integrase
MFAASPAALESSETDRDLFRRVQRQASSVGQEGLQERCRARGQGDTLRHTAATWLMQRCAPISEAAGFLGMSPEVLQDSYGHHHPDYLQGAAAAIGQKGRFVSVVETVVGLTDSRNTTKSLMIFGRSGRI